MKIKLCEISKPKTSHILDARNGPYHHGEMDLVQRNWRWENMKGGVTYGHVAAKPGEELLKQNAKS